MNPISHLRRHLPRAHRALGWVFRNTGWSRPRPQAFQALQAPQTPRDLRDLRDLRDPLLPSPFDVEMTPRMKDQLAFGFEVMKVMHSDHIFLWLAEDGWQSGSELRAWQHSPTHVAVRIKPWEALVLHTPLSMN